MRSGFVGARSTQSALVRLTPEPPRVFMDTTFPTFNGTVWNVTDNASMNAAIAGGVGGDVAVIANGATLTGQFNFRARGDSQYMGFVDQRIHAGTFPRTPGDAVSNQLLRPLQRARPSDFATLTSKFTATSANVCFTFDPGAAWYWFAGLEISGPASSTGGGVALIDIRDQIDDSRIAFQPNHLVFDRCYIHGTAGVDTRRAILANGQHIAAIDCWIEEIHGVGFESCGFASYNGAGPFKIVSDYIAAGTENILFGGADPAIVGLVPGDIEASLLHLYKDPAWIGAGYGIKDHFESKNGSRIQLKWCVFENSWQDGQTGNSLLFQPLNDDGQFATGIEVTDIDVSYVLVKNAGSGIVIASRVAFGTGTLPILPFSRASFKHMLFQDIGLRTPANGFPTVNDGGRLILTGGDCQYVTFDHITGKAPTLALDFPASGLPSPTGYKFTNNIWGRGDFGIFGDSKGEGSVPLNFYGGDYTYKNTVLYDSLASPGDGAFNPSVRYAGLDASNTFLDLGAPGSENAVGFVDPSTNQWGLGAGSPYKGAGSDGLDLGCDVAGLNTNIANVVQSR